MDYTGLDIVVNALHIEEHADDDLLLRLVTAASRAVDRIVSGSAEAVDYFKAENVGNEIIRGLVGVDHRMLSFPRKSKINSIASLEWRINPMDSWKLIESTRYFAESGKIETWMTASYIGKAQVRLNYNGGHGAAIDDLPGDLVEAATLVCGRYYREDESGLTDSIGIAELGVLTYTKAMPQRFVSMIQPFVRRQPW